MTWHNPQWGSLKTITIPNSQPHSDNGDLIHTHRKTLWEFNERNALGEYEHWLIHKNLKNKLANLQGEKPSEQKGKFWAFHIIVFVNLIT